jgi:hypothetical protein
MPAWLTLKLAGYILAAVAVIGALWWLYSAITAAPKAEARLGRNQAEAAQESGSDAVNAVGAAAERESSSADLTRTNEQEIRNAEGADAAVAAPARDAGLASLCKRRAYSRDPRCVQRSDPR